MVHYVSECSRWYQLPLLGHGDALPRNWPTPKVAYPQTRESFLLNTSTNDCQSPGVVGACFVSFPQSFLVGVRDTGTMVKGLALLSLSPHASINQCNQHIRPTSVALLEDFMKGLLWEKCKQNITVFKNGSMHRVWGENDVTKRYGQGRLLRESDTNKPWRI